MSARTAAELADRRRDLAQHDIRAADPLGRAAAYALAAQQAPALVLVGSWLVSLVRDGVRPAHVREALADALAGIDELGLLNANEALGDALVEIGMAVGLPRPTAQRHWGAAEVLAVVERRPEPACAEQMARYWLACISAGNDPEVAAGKLLRVFDLVPCYRPEPSLEDQ